MKTTLSVIKADIGGYPGHETVHPDLMKLANEMLAKAKKEGKITDFYVGKCGDDLNLILTHTKGVDNKDVHALAWDVFKAGTEVAKKLKLYGAGQDLLKDAFSGNVRGMGPGVAELEFEERKSEPVVVFMMDKTDPGAFNLPIYRMFADPFCTPGLVIDPAMQGGFTFEVYDTVEGRKIRFKTPEEMYAMLAFVGSRSRYVIKRVYPGPGNKVPEDEAVCCISTEKLSQVAGQYVGKDDPVGIVRGQGGLPAIGEIVEPFAFPHLVAGWMRGSHQGPLMPVAQENAIPTRLDGPPRVVALGFQLANGTLVGPVDIFKDIAYDHARKKANKIAEYMRRHGPFEPHRLPEEDLEYTNLPKLQQKFKDRFSKI
ncbi:MAG: fructose-1,6-bisphosphate aldolase/phosphatase [Candidatus ainarchaeum sp.]|nr:fructose-1,6-bisphosphate aldolase/phosphatase [Candidatus ainarchaeum sp.]